MADTGNSTTVGEVSIVPEPTGDPFNRAVLGKAVGTISNNLFLDGSVRVAIAGESTLRASATGEPGGADVSYTAGTVTVNADTLGPSAPATLDPGESVSYTTSVGQAVITVNEPTVTESLQRPDRHRRRRRRDRRPHRRQRNLTAGNGSGWICCRCGPQPLRRTGASTVRLPRRCWTHRPTARPSPTPRRPSRAYGALPGCGCRHFPRRESDRHDDGQQRRELLLHAGHGDFLRRLTRRQPGPS